jgi:diguanylate cyclase (GGDEF)-like protein/PAS domain S-box-containing protein
MTESINEASWLKDEERSLPPSRSLNIGGETFASDAEIPRRLMVMFSVAIMAFLLVEAGGTLKAMAGEVVAVWIADGYLLGHTMAAPRQRKPFILVGGTIGLLVADLLRGEGLYASLSFTLAGMVEVCVATLLVPDVKSAKELVVPKAFLRFVFVAGLLAPTLSGLVAVVLLEGFFTNHPFSSFSNWVISDALGFVIFTPVSLVILSGEWRSLLEPGNRIKSVALLALVGSATALIFAQTSYLSLYWVLPPLAFLAFQAELSTVLLGTLLFIGIAVPLTVRGTGPLWLDSFHTMQERVLALQLFAVAALSIVLPITILQAQRNGFLALLADGHRRFRHLAEHSDEVIVQLSPDGEFQYVSPRVLPVLGYEPQELVGTLISTMVHDDDWQRVKLAMTAASTGHTEQSVQYRLRLNDSSFIWVRSFIAAMPSGPSDDYAAIAFTVRDINSYVLSEQRRIAEEERLKQLAYIDSLTGLKNRRYFDAKFTDYFQVAPGITSVRQVAVLFVDVDYFKKYNDMYGHQAGDECLSAVARRIDATIREADVLARYGGEEFVVLLDGCPYSVAVAAAERIRANVEALAMAHEASPLGVVTLSIGVAHSTERETNDAHQILVQADIALYEAKRLGRNRVCHRHSVHVS